MPFQISNFLASIRRRLAPSLSAALSIFWWIILGLLLSLLLGDALIFYSYGLGRVSLPLPVEAADVSTVQEGIIHSVAGLIEKRRAQFQAAPGAPADLVNPFR